MFKEVEVIVFDADDTLWVNEPYFREAEKRFEKLLSEYASESEIYQKLYKKEIDNLKHYGYGVKGFVLSMIECALEVSNYKVSQKVLDEVLCIGKEMLHEPLQIIDGVEDLLKQLQGNYKLVVATKGDLLDQERKFFRSGLDKFFDRIVVMSNKKEDDYRRLFNDLMIKEPSKLLMIGNSLKSDVIPVVKLGGKSVHIPFHTTWVHEEVESSETNGFEYLSLGHISQLLPYLL